MEENTIGISETYMDTVHYVEKDFMLSSKDWEIKNIKNLIESGKQKKAEEILATYHKVERVSSDWINPFDESEIFETFVDEDDDYLFKLPGVLGDLVDFF